MMYVNTTGHEIYAFVNGKHVVRTEMGSWSHGRMYNSNCHVNVIDDEIFKIRK
ncbi:hypothetical protein SETIT_3G244000v2 [Setaria italica]|uniref:Uncharacterized protein n=2 Tax=Setaria TaxID=4554 RepID=A0A368QKD9_SETIT|nr:hypothetical protein SETIT_3G244000v2 [Setaria italica]TKW27317.1 hypothetical protein SEVIR_3G249700v2 [Setaria viridis]